MTDICRNIPESSPDREISLVRSYCNEYDRLSLEAQDLQWKQKIEKLNEMAGVLNTIRGIVNERNSPLSNNTPNGINIEYQNMPFPFRIRAGKKDSYDYVRQEIHPTIDKNVWEMTVVFRKLVTNAHIPIETSVRFEVTNDSYNGIIIKYNGRSYIIPPQYGHGHKREQNFIQIADMKFDIEFLR